MLVLYFWDAHQSPCMEVRALGSSFSLKILLAKRRLKVCSRTQKGLGIRGAGVLRSCWVAINNSIAVSGLTVG